MIPVDYLTLRLIRRFFPSPLVHWAMKLRLGIEPGLETREPEKAGDRYEAAVQVSGSHLQGKRILILGYGGYFGLGVNLLERGAGHVVLLDPYARANHEMNLALAQGESPFLTIQNGQVTPQEEWITIIHDINQDYQMENNEPIDLVFSSSVLEHVSSPQELIQDLTSITHAEGLHIHFVDLRDHFFKYPFEMLCHSEAVWSRFLNPSSNLNRLRVWDFEEIFKRYFQIVDIEIFEKELASFRKAKSRIRPEFISGNEDANGASRLLIKASLPLTGS